jgi:ABC-type lipoprotein export system ATPase subunit
VLIASHDLNVWKMADLVYELKDGKLVERGMGE